MFLTTRGLKDGEEAPVNFIAGRIGKLDRMCSSSLTVEAYSMVAGVGCLEWKVATYGELTNASYDSTFIRYRVVQWDTSTPLQAHGLSLDGVVVCISSTDEVLKENLAITDAKSLFDALKK